MTAYCAQADMQARFTTRLLIQLTDLPESDATPPATTITLSVLDQAIADASNLIDSYLSVEYALPLPSTPPYLVSIACDLTLAALYRRNPMAVPESVTAGESAAKGWLKKVQDRDVRLFPAQADDDAADIGEGAGMPETNDLRRDFSMRNMKDVL
jgi:phage gp36-like protein